PGLGVFRAANQDSNARACTKQALSSDRPYTASSSCDDIHAGSFSVEGSSLRPTISSPGRSFHACSTEALAHSSFAVRIARSHRERIAGMRNTSEDDRGPDRIARVLHTLRMRSTFYCHAELGAPWALEMPAIADSVSFHVVTTGSCWLGLPDTEPIDLRAGD